MSVPGVVIASSIQGSHVVEAHGFRSSLDLPTPLLMQADTSFDLASLTKIIATTSSLMELVSQKVIDIDNKVSQFLPGWHTNEKREITLRDLLSHRSGLAEWWPLYIAASNIDHAHEIIATTPLKYETGQGRHYSDLGFITLGKVITSITSQSLENSVTELSLSKVTLMSTQFASPKDINNVASTSRGDRIEKTMIETQTPYSVIEKVEEFKSWRTQILSGEVNDGNAFHLFQGVSSHAGLFSTAQDLLLFGDSLLQRPELASFIEDGIDPDFHLGFRSWVDTCGSCTTRFYGHTGFTGVILVFSPLHSSVFVVLTNRLHIDSEPTPTETIFSAYLKGFHSQLH